MYDDIKTHVRDVEGLQVSKKGSVRNVGLRVMAGTITAIHVHKPKTD